MSKKTISEERKRGLKAGAPLLLALVYGVSPLDLVPDILPLIGLLDDATIGSFLLVVSLVTLYRAKRTVRIEQQRALSVDV